MADADLDTLQSLVEKSLLRFTDGRYWMLETIREFAAQRLGPSPDARAIRQRHADYVVRFATLGPEAGSRLDSLDDEQDNVRAAFGWLNETSQTEAQLQLVAAMTDFWGVRGQWLEGRRWADAALAQSEGSRSAGRARALEGAGLLAQSLGDWEAAKAYGEEGLALFRELGDPKSIGQALVSLALLAAEVGEFDEAARMYDEAILRAQEADARKLHADALGGLGDAAMRQRDYARATSLIEESLAIYRELGNDFKAGWALYNLAFCLFRTGQSRRPWPQLVRVSFSRAAAPKQRRGRSSSSPQLRRGGMMTSAGRNSWGQLTASRAFQHAAHRRGGRIASRDGGGDS